MLLGLQIMWRRYKENNKFGQGACITKKNK